jgi:hypothetical protein
MAELADAADSKSADIRVLGVRLPSRHQRESPQNKRLAGVVSPHETHSTSDAADLASSSSHELRIYPTENGEVI